MIVVVEVRELGDTRRETRGLLTRCIERGSYIDTHTYCYEMSVSGREREERREREREYYEIHEKIKYFISVQETRR